MEGKKAEMLHANAIRAVRLWRHRVSDFQIEKELVRAYYEGLARATPENVADILAPFTAPNWHWRGMHPFHEQFGAQAVADTFWTPFLTAMTRVQRRPDTGGGVIDFISERAPLISTPSANCSAIAIIQ